MRVMATLRAAAVLAATMLATGCVLGLASVQGSGNIVTLEPDLTGFTAVSAGHGARVQVTAGSTHSVVVRIDDNLEEHLRVAVDGSRLEIGLAPMLGIGRRHFEVDVTMPDLEAVWVSGGSRVALTGFDVDHRVDVRTSGGARIEGELRAAHLSVSTSGGSRTELRGAGESVRVDSSGGSRANLAAFAARTADVRLSGGSRAEVLATTAVSGGISGGASLTYGGDPATVDVGRSGGGRISAR